LIPKIPIKPKLRITADESGRIDINAQIKRLKKRNEIIKIATIETAMLIIDEFITRDINSLSKIINPLDSIAISSFEFLDTKFSISSEILTISSVDKETK
tara:strand:- start:1 stop:300 length:300 start_codon:yes stop_codon:yes gene_type:complete